MTAEIRDFAYSCDADRRTKNDFGRSPLHRKHDNEKAELFIWGVYRYPLPNGQVVLLKR
jgi:hypothetical protein